MSQNASSRAVASGLPIAGGDFFEELAVSIVCPDLSYLNQTSTETWLTWIDEDLPALLARMKTAGGCQTFANIPADTRDKVLGQFLHNANRYCALLDRTEETLRTKPVGHNKVLVFFQYHRTADAFNKVLRFKGHRSELFHKSTSLRERERLLSAFGDPEDSSIQILICLYTVTLLCLNLQYSCCTIFEAEQPFNSNHRVRARGAIHRIGQTQQMEFLSFQFSNTEEAIHEMFIGRLTPTGVKEAMLAFLKNHCTRVRNRPGGQLLLEEEIKRIGTENAIDEPEAAYPAMKQAREASIDAGLVWEF